MGGSGITYIVGYACPHCGARLEGRTATPDAWLRCPGCGRASRPPDHAVTPEGRAPARPAAGPAEDVLVVGPSPSPSSSPSPGPRAMTPVAVAAPAPASASASTAARRGAADPASPVRVALAAALFVAVVMLVFSFLDQSPIGLTVFSVASVVLLILLARPVPRPS